MYKFNPKIRVLLIQFHPTMEKRCPLRFLKTTSINLNLLN